jgi:protocatechuate 3,4-dioxygenase beta subunit
VDVSQPDYSPNTGRVEISADADTDDFVVKLSRGGTITGLVRDAQKQPVPNTGVLLTKVPMGGGPQTVSTGPDGRYNFEKIAPGEYMVIRAPTGGGPLMLFGGMKQVVVKEGETTVHDLDEAAKINITGRVLKAGQPVANAMMFFSSGDGNGPPTDLKQSRTDADGRYQIGLDAAGAYSVVVSTGGMFMGGGRSAIAVQVPDQPNPVLDITMKTAGISGRVVNLEGKPVSGAMITATANDAAGSGGGGHRDPGMRAQSEPDGTFLIDGVDPGTYTIAASASGYRDASAPPVTVSNENDVPSVEVRLEPGRMLRGRVVDQNGNGIAGAFVSAGVSGAPPGGRDASPGTTDVNGAFLITVPADGPIDVAAFSAGFPPARAVSYQPQEGVELTLRTPRPAHVRVSVLDASGTALAGATVTCNAEPYYPRSGFLSMINPTPPTGADGTTVVSALAPGSYQLNVSSGAKKATQAVTVTEGAEVVATVTIP